MHNFSIEDEELIRAFIFTNPHADISLVYPQQLISGEELSPLMSAYSRTHVPMQDRVLEFLDKEKNEQTKAMLNLIRPLMQIFCNPDGSLKVSPRTTGFNKKWVLQHGHSSIKEETTVFGHVENIADIVGKKITGHALNRPQVKSTRYLSYKEILDLSLKDEDLCTLQNSERIIEHIAWMNQRYLECTDALAELARNHPLNQEFIGFLRSPDYIDSEIVRRVRQKQKAKSEYGTPKDISELLDVVRGESSDEAIRESLRKFVLDSSRVYLLAATKTSLGFSSDARTIEEIITDLISSPRKEDQRVGKELWNEAKKIAPVLLGEKSHIHIDNWKVKNETELRQYIEERWKLVKEREVQAKEIQSREAHGEVTIITPKDMDMYSDRFNAALVLFPYLDLPLEVIYNDISDSDIKDILARAHESRGSFDAVHPAISHGGLMQQFLMGYHAYRDLFRHRRGSRSVQLLTTRLGFEVPEQFTALGIDQRYRDDMEVCRRVYEEARMYDVHIAEKLVPFGALCRALHSWQVNQAAYVAAIRTRAKTGNASYVRVVREMIEKIAGFMPETAKYFRYDTKEYPPELWKSAYDWFDENKRPKR